MNYSVKSSVLGAAEQCEGVSARIDFQLTVHVATQRVLSSMPLTAVSITRSGALAISFSKLIDLMPPGKPEWGSTFCQWF